MQSCNPRLALRFLARAPTTAHHPHLSTFGLHPRSKPCLPSINSISLPVGRTSYPSTSATHSSPWPSTKGVRFASSSTRRWTDRQRGDQFARAAKVQGLKSRAAFKLLQINERYRLFKPGMTVVDLGFAPGSWSQVAVDLTKPRGRVLGVDLLPVQPPKGVSTIQGNFLSPDIQAEIKSFLRDPDRGRLRRPLMLGSSETSEDGLDQAMLEEEATGYLERESHEKTLEEEHNREHLDKSVDVVLSDMLMNTSGNAFRDHAGSMAKSKFKLLTLFGGAPSRISAERRCNSATTRSKSADTLCASSTRGSKTRLSRGA
ncbi:hypothetical protein, variant 3 [Cladophialophora immunda]|uniref:rRNA methyltransferase 2, mitochondrial n=1 Tax=Cladophialophora immunda TaxID=569365 RepID=A0A0D2CHF7_9EURO|nr:hypothetical protein, variant 3 [Cladophialophora immunda]KIW29610.1 hypothetical protein, variant 3 [Cladophialophora immunda]